LWPARSAVADLILRRYASANNLKYEINGVSIRFFVGIYLLVPKACSCSQARRNTRNNVSGDDS
jgi:hypothetical protein